MTCRPCKGNKSHNQLSFDVGMIWSLTDSGCRTCCPAVAATYYAGAYYLGRYRGAHSWDNFAASGAVAGAGVALWLIRPLKARPVAFGVLLGGLLGGGAASLQQVGGTSAGFMGSSCNALTCG